MTPTNSIEMYKEQINATVTQVFPLLGITQESLIILCNFLQDTLMWCVLESGKHAERDGSKTIFSHHMQTTLKKLLQTPEDPIHAYDALSLSVSSATVSPVSTPSHTPSPNSSFGSLHDSLGVPPPSAAHDQTPANKEPPPLEYIVTKSTHAPAQIVTSPCTSYFFLIDEALTRFEERIQPNLSWGNPVITDDVTMWKRQLTGSVVTTKAEGEINRAASDVFTAIMDFHNQKKWNNVLYEYKVVDMFDKHTMITYQKYRSKHCLLTSERDFCTVLHWMEKFGTYTLVSESVEHEKCPPVKGTTRGRMINSGYRVVPVGETRCRVTYLVEVDLVYIPTVVVGVMQNQLNLVPRLRYYLTGSKACPPPSTPNSTASASESFPSLVPLSKISAKD